MAALRKAFTTGGTEVHGVWPRCEGLHHGTTEVHGYGHAAKGFTTGATGGAQVWLTLRRASPPGARRCTGSGSHREGFSQQLPK